MDTHSVHSLDSDEYQFIVKSRPKVRRGSEGYEIRPVDKEEILRRYILSRGQEDGYYQRYEPEGPYEGEEEGEEAWGDGDEQEDQGLEDDDAEDTTPLARIVPIHLD